MPTTEALLRGEMEAQGVGLSEGEALWCSPRYTDGHCVSLYVLHRSTEPESIGDLSLHRAHSVRGVPHASVLMEFSGSALESGLLDSPREEYQLDWLTAIEEKLDGGPTVMGHHVSMLWSYPEEDGLAFVARALKVGEEDRLVCGQLRDAERGICVGIEFDTTVSALVEGVVPTAPSRGPLM